MRVITFPADIYLSVLDKHNIRVDKGERASQILTNGQIWSLANGNFQVASQSRAGKFHQINPREESCTCEYGSNNVGLCVHLTAWLILRDIPLRYIELDPVNPITIREQVALTNRPAKRTEWQEELV